MHATGQPLLDHLLITSETYRNHNVKIQCGELPRSQKLVLNSDLLLDGFLVRSLQEDIEDLEREPSASQMLAHRVCELLSNESHSKLLFTLIPTIHVRSLKQQ